MKTYKTWELLKMAEENYAPDDRKREYINAGGTTVNFGMCGSGRGLFSNKFVLRADLTNEEWTLVQQPVTFMEAAKAFNRGLIVRCEYINFDDRLNVDKKEKLTLTFRQGGENGCMDATELTFYLCTTGKWYIEEVD